MPEVIIPVKLKGKRGEINVNMLANSLSDFVILTPKVAEEVGPELLGYEEELEVGGGGRISGQLSVVELEVKDPESGVKRKDMVRAVILKEEKRCVIGIEALEKLGISLNLREGKFKLE